MKAIIFLISLFVLFLCNSAEAASGKKILFIPIDNRPIVLRETVEAAVMSGYEVLTPPQDIIGNAVFLGDSDKMWNWLRKNAPGSSALVVSTDSLIYGSLIASRKHNMTKEEISARVKKFEEFHRDFPNVPIYAYGIIMRTLLSAGHSGGQDAADYEKYAVLMRDYSIYEDKLDMGKGKNGDERKFRAIENQIPSGIIKSFKERRDKNYDAHRKLIDLTRNDTLAYTLLGCDDGAIFSRTHYEARHLREYGKDLPKTRFQVLSGADELGVLMLARAINDIEMHIPFVTVDYNEGKGRDTVPSYTNDTIGEDIDGAIRAAGAIKIMNPKRADLALVINTNPEGNTFEGGSTDPKSNTTKMRDGTKSFMTLLRQRLNEGAKVAVGDIAYANGSDNALLHGMQKENLLFKVRYYSGWNTATNSTGFLIGAGLLARNLSEEDRLHLLFERYLDEWAYQSNVRASLFLSFWAKEPKDPMYLKEHTEEIRQEGEVLMNKFVAQNIPLPPSLQGKKLTVDFPWNRLFEIDVRVK